METFNLKLIILPPLLSFFAIFFFSKLLNKKAVSFLASAAILTSFIFSLKAFFALIKLPQEDAYLKEFLYLWFSSGNITAYVSLVFDRLSAVMALMVSGVSFLIHIYSIGYMNHDKDFKRFFSYLNLFVFFMLLLVLADNPVVMFVGWEGVGLCSYLLIGFWYEDIQNSKAGKKAFITNRIGDAAFIIGLILLIAIFSQNGIYSFDFETIKKNHSLLLNYNILGFSSAALIALLLFFAATGKSAQFPLYVWLPDAMAGPTPVSALIHAATMVTAGVYMMCRVFFLFEAAPETLEAVIFIASFTAALSAIIACFQDDIKKILAYSTISQIGYMFMGLGAKAFSGGFFHLITHAFFKALLFLAAGSVIHALSGEQNIFKMGGLKSKIKYTFILMLAGWVAISGIPPFSGYFSKDFIIETVYLSGHKTIWLIAVITAGLTAYYMTRMIKIPFLTKENPNLHPHESPLIMLWPMGILAVLSLIFGGFFLAFMNFIKAQIPHEHISFQIKYAPTFAAGLGIFLGFYLTEERRALMIKEKFLFFHKFAYNKFYIDELYEKFLINPFRFLSEKISFNLLDRKIIDSFTVEGVAKLSYKSGELFRHLQNGNIQTYAAFFVAGILLFMLAVILNGAGFLCNF